MRASRYVVIVCALAWTGTPMHAQDRTITVDGREVSVWVPNVPRGTKGPLPVLIYSHGFGACANRASFLTKALAAHGYWVFAPQHRDGGCVRQFPGRPAIPFRDAAQWSDRTYADRRDDVHAVERALRADSSYASRVDFSRLGYLGHSLGGYTAVGLAGGWSTWAGTPPPRAVLAMSPYVEPFLSHATLAGVGVPVMLQGGTSDFGITPTLTRPDGAYDALRAPKYLVVFTGARHVSWSDGAGSDVHSAIVEYAIAFLDHYVRDETPSPLLTTNAPDVSSLRFDSELGRSTDPPAPTTRARRRVRL